MLTEQESEMTSSIAENQPLGVVLPERSVCQYTIWPIESVSGETYCRRSGINWRRTEY